MKNSDRRQALWAHLVSEHCAILDPMESLKDLAELHREEHKGPGGIRDHNISARSYSLKKIGEVLSEAEDEC